MYTFLYIDRFRHPVYTLRKKSTDVRTEVLVVQIWNYFQIDLSKNGARKNRTCWKVIVKEVL